MAKDLFCTLGPASMNKRVLNRLEELGATLFRINLSHTKLEDVAAVIDFIQSHSAVPVCLDSEGAQIRTGSLAQGSVAVQESTVICARREAVAGDAQTLNFYPHGIVDSLEVGDFISIDFNAMLVQVIEITAAGAMMRVLTGGVIGQNKAVTVERPIDMPPLTDKDRAALRIGRDKGLEHAALSFANRETDVDAIREIVGAETFVISKIECRNGLHNLAEIAAKSDGLLIDRGDLSRELPVERIPALQKHIVRIAKVAGRKVYVATNLLESMITAPGPTRAEVNDVYNTLVDGVDGLVLAAETAIGAHPIGCASMIVKLIREYEAGPEAAAGGYDLESASLLVEPHGGRLVHREQEAPAAAELARLASLTVEHNVLMDCQQIAHGTYSPLTGFMTQEMLRSVLRDNRLPQGEAWTLPIVLQVDSVRAGEIHPGERILLKSEAGVAHALLDVAEVYALDFDAVVEPWFGTASMDHPGVARLAGGGGHLVGGDITLFARLPSPYRQFELTPAQTRFVFSHKGWNRVVGFHTRNVIHRVHEHIQLSALERSGADGLYVSPVIGPKKSGDFLPEPIMRSYQMMLDGGLYPAGKVVLGSFATYSRYAGPREAVFTALCRKNMGCSHFIVGRDHTGVGDFYAAEEIPALFDSLGDIGLTPIFFDAIGYDPKAEAYVALGAAETLEPISGTDMRQALRAGEALPDWFMRDVIQDMLRAELNAGQPVFSE
ncbi:MAG: pyruvate kinase [Alphaproteobacteria bacterium]|nr:pyruvate kinase [Alphaproteobacteria bacterium]MDP6589206.1 pyruvate kinase [Alphaproteobacteria bacterium]MDP6816685.1 pyruvate kinase [Alphaproteobacteria bacterium]